GPPCARAIGPLNAIEPEALHMRAPQARPRRNVAEPPASGCGRRRQCQPNSFCDHPACVTNTGHLRPFVSHVRTSFAIDCRWPEQAVAGMERRRLLRFVGGAAAWPVVAHAQQSNVPPARLALLNSQSVSSLDPHVIAARRQGLTENGLIEGICAALGR